MALKASLIAAVLAASTLLGVPIAAAQHISQNDADRIAVEAYLYFYPLVTMDLTRRQLSSIKPGPDTFGGTENWFRNFRAYPSADARSIVRTNFDTLYSSTFLDLTEEPMVVSVPDTDGRYYILQMLDMWTDVFAAPGWRTTGTGAGHFLITPPKWRPDLGDDFATELGLPAGTQRIDSPTRHVWIIGRTKTDGPSDYAAVHAIQDGYKITPLSKWGETVSKPPFAPDPTVDVKTPPKAQVRAMSGAEYFTAALEVLKEEPPHITDQSILARMARLGIVPGESFDIDSADAVVKKAIEAAPKTALQLMDWKAPQIAEVVNGWSMDIDTVGVYGNYYLKRAILTDIGLGANLPQDAVYPIASVDGSGDPLDGSKTDYVLHFEKSEIPPVDAFWSVTVYDNDGYPVPNSLNRFALSSWMSLARNADGSLDLYIQHESPGADKEANWLPAPAGPFNLTMRLYAPRPEILVGKWVPPAITKSSPASQAASAEPAVPKGGTLASDVAPLRTFAPNGNPGATDFDVADRAAIANLIAAYAFAYDNYAAEAWLSLFTDDAVFVAGEPGTPAVAFSGDGFRSFWTERMKTFRTSGEQRRHLMSNILFLEQTADSAHVSVGGLLTSTKDGQHFAAVSSLNYEGWLVKRPDGWKFQRWHDFPDAAFGQ